MTTARQTTKTIGTLATGDIVKAGRRRAVIVDPCSPNGHALFRYIVKGRLAKGNSAYRFASNVAQRADEQVEVLGTYNGPDLA